jgi:tetratricopeptide (TPR) repeat protein
MDSHSGDFFMGGSAPGAGSFGIWGERLYNYSNTIVPLVNHILEGRALFTASNPSLYCRLVLCCLLGVLGGNCAGVRPPSAVPAREQETGSPKAVAISRLRQEFARAEAKLPGAGFERANLLIGLARTSYLLADLSPRETRQVYLDKASYFAELLLKEQPRWVEGYYWSSMSLCGNAEICGAARALKVLPEIVARLEQAAAIDPSYDQAGPHRVLGRIYSEAPAWPFSVGDLNKSLEHLRMAVKIAPNNSTNQLFLGETLLRLEKREEARRALEAVFSCTDHAVWPQGVEHDRRQAEKSLRQLE